MTLIIYSVSMTCGSTVNFAQNPYAMIKTLRILLFCILMTAICSPIGAQNYVVDNLFGDSIRVCEIIFNKDKTAESPGKTLFYLQPGDTVTVTRILMDNSYPAVTIKGENGEFTLNYHDLRFCDNNPDGTVDHWVDMKWNKNREIKKFFATFIPYAIIAILCIAAIAFLFVGLKVKLLRKPALYVVPACLLIASLLEILAYWFLGTTAFWWCDPDKYGFWGALFRVIPFVAFVAFQFYSIKLYMRLLTDNEDNKLSVKPMLLSIGLCVPVTLVVAFSCAGFFNVKSPWLEIITIITFLATLGIGLFVSTKKNLKELGKAKGTLFTLFGIVWAIGAVVALIGLIMVIFQLLVQVLMVVAGIFAMAMVSTTRYKDSAGNIYEEDGFGNIRRIR